MKLSIFRRHKPKQVDLEEYLADARQRGLDKEGHFVPDPTPMAPPVGYERRPSLAEQIRSMVRSEKLRQEVEAAGAETFEEAEDFDIPDDPVDRHTPYENEFDPDLSQLVSEGQQALNEKAAKAAAAATEPPPAPPPSREPSPK